MAFLSCTSDFSPLFRLLDDYETHRSRPAPTTSSGYYTKSTNPSTTATSTSTPTSTASTFFTPAFDVRELNDAYYLDGELPGVDQSNIDIEFTDSQTLVVKGRTERNYHSSSSQLESQQHDQEQPSSPSRASSPRWHQPTVEDDDEDMDAHSVTSLSSSRSHSHSHPHSTSAVMVHKPSAAPATTKSGTSSTATDYYWAAERSIGEFQRTFAFPMRVDQDGVRAALKNGILSIIVPKEAARKTKKIRIE